MPTTGPLAHGALRVLRLDRRLSGPQDDGEGIGAHSRFVGDLLVVGGDGIGGQLRHRPNKPIDRGDGARRRRHGRRESEREDVRGGRDRLGQPCGRATPRRVGDERFAAQLALECCALGVQPARDGIAAVGGLPGSDDGIMVAARSDGTATLRP